MNDIIKKYKGVGYDLSCSETIFYAANDNWWLGLSE